MLPSGQRRNKNQRLIPLTLELMQDMLDNEGYEYQTPTGARQYTSEEDSVARTAPNNDLQWDAQYLNADRLSVDSRQSCDSDSVREYCGDTDRKFTRLLDLKDHKDLLYFNRSDERLSSSTDTESSNLQSLVNMLCSAERLDIQKDTESSVDSTSQLSDYPETFAMEYLCIKPSRRRLYTARSDSLISKPAQVEKRHDFGIDNYHRTNQDWINMVVVNKSETSFLLNQYKLQNFKTNSCNAYYTPESKDLRRDYEAVASLLATPRCKRNSRNAYW